MSVEWSSPRWSFAAMPSDRAAERGSSPARGLKSALFPGPTTDVKDRSLAQDGVRLDMSALAPSPPPSAGDAHKTSSTHEDEASKAKRAHQACLNCRKRKSRCLL